MALSELVVELSRGCPGGYVPGTILRYINVPRNWRPPDWHASAGARPWLGTLPADATTVDIEREARELAASIPPPPRPALRKDAVMTRYGFTRDAQLEEATDRFGLPKGRDMDKTDGAVIGARVLDHWHEWPQEELDAYDEALGRVFPRALPRVTK